MKKILVALMLVALVVAPALALAGASERYIWATDSTNQNRVKFYMQKAAIAVMSEADTTPNHYDRLIYARQVLQGWTSIFEYALGVTTNGTISSTIDANNYVLDGDIEFVVNSLFDAFAG
jgi:hypothetical protein